MYHTVARRLGIHTIMTIYRAVAIAVIWKPEYNIKSWNNAEYFYMNHNSNLPYPSNIVRKRCQNNEHQLNLSEPIDYICITREIMMNIVQGFIYNHAVHYGWKFNIFNSFLVSCIFRNVASIDIEVEYKNITKSIKIKSDKKRFTKRTKNIKFAVGMIVRHTRDDYSSINKHDGVIIGWHRTCKRILNAAMFPFLYQISNYHHICKCHLLSNAQTHYIILAENNRICYVPEVF
ncbi:uncharacterized protein LOC126855599 isoform X3 [Cataglyphis hispanica]|uniref:uncharacterized protein LOC126855599 isoform X3 n=1 Tax=Cataglyphis hispanica TaxID=1086592 RepID=UPI0021802E25|nr:uncharacterized protein LOC126855599 isoform X3 [Cataglyphis hispanica]